MDEWLHSVLMIDVITYLGVILCLYLLVKGGEGVFVLWYTWLKSQYSRLTSYDVKFQIKVTLKWTSNEIWIKWDWLNANQIFDIYRDLNTALIGLTTKSTFHMHVLSLGSFKATSLRDKHDEAQGHDSIQRLSFQVWGFPL